MDKNSIKKYAVWARRELIARVSQKALQYGISETDFGDVNADSVNGMVLSPKEKTQRASLIAKVQKDGYQQAMEEAAYTWFNRFTALRYMEVNAYLPSHVRVFTNDQNEFKPQIIDEAINLEIDGLDLDKVYDYKDANKTEELYKYLLITQCNDLGKILPGMFTRISDYTEILFPDNLLREGSVIEQMITLIPEESWLDSVEIIGWLYQFYICDPKDSLINAKKQYKINDIPFVTQIFTSEWIVKYMVQNSLGRYWLNLSKKSNTDFEWNYYLSSDIEENNNESVLDNPEQIRVIDPCMGSGHILVYAFDILMDIYGSCGYSQREAAELILRNNLYGMDISERAYQLSYFSVMMKARKYDRNILKKEIKPNIYFLKNLDSMNADIISFISDNDYELKETLNIVNNELNSLGEFGSLIHTTERNYSALLKRIEEISNKEYDNLIDQGLKEECISKIYDYISIAKLLSNEYDVVVTNPPYIGNKFLPNAIRAFIENNYKEYKSDIFSAFIVRVLKMCKSGGHIGMLTPYVWMFISTYEELRNQILANTCISSLVQLEYNAFEAACVPVCTFTLQKDSNNKYGEYVRLSDFRGSENQGPKVLQAVENRNCGYRYTTCQNDFYEIPGSPIAYWVDKKVIDCFRNGKRVDTFAFPKQGMATADNNRFLRLWFEVNIDKVCFNCNSCDDSEQLSSKWFPYNKGGGFKKWYGNNEYVVNWENNGYELRNFKGSVIRSPQFYFKEGISWCKITSSNFSMRYIPQGFIFDVAGCTLFSDRNELLYLLGFMNSSINEYILELISPTLNYEVGHVGSLPIIFDKDYFEEVNELVSSCISICQEDWDSYENSWEFKKNPLITGESNLSDIYKSYELNKTKQFTLLKNNEERINHIFSNIYSVNGIIKEEVLDEDIIIGKSNYKNDMTNLISYAVGCMFGRYSLDEEGLICAGNKIDVTRYKTYSVVIDNIIPIAEEGFFNNDIVDRFVDFICAAFGKDKLEQNLKFIADALEYKGSSRDVIRQYFINDFFNDHCDLYTSRGAGKRPIYWLFDSGKKNGFKALIYMHRYQPDTIARIRTDYVHEQQNRYRTAISDIEQRMSAASTSERVKLTKELRKLNEQADELLAYEEKIHHLADQMISIDLDDGVKNNYEIFKDVLAKIK